MLLSECHSVGVTTVKEAVAVELTAVDCDAAPLGDVARPRTPFATEPTELAAGPGAINPDPELLGSRFAAVAES